MSSTQIDQPAEVPWTHLQGSAQLFWEDALGGIVKNRHHESDKCSLGNVYKLQINSNNNK